MAYIQNISLEAAINGDYNKDNNTILIRILDPLEAFPPIANQHFIETYHFNFVDSELNDFYGNDIDENRISIDQAEAIASILLKAKQNDNNIVVHCKAGIARSGAVVAAGLRLGFYDTFEYRDPNKMVLNEILRALGLTYDETQVRQI